MPSIHCSVDRCYKSTYSKHRFPNPSKNINIFNKWVILSGNKRLILEMTPEKVFNNCRICSLHFLPQDFGANRRLKKGVLPSVKLPDPLEEVKHISTSETTDATPSGVPILSKKNESPCSFELIEALNAQFEKMKSKKEVLAIARPGTSKAESISSEPATGSFFKSEEETLEKFEN